MANKYLSPPEAAAKNWYSKHELKIKFRLKPAKNQRIVGTVWQGQGTYYVYDKAQCIDMRPYRAPTEKQREALMIGRSLLGTKVCNQCQKRFSTEWRGKICPDCKDKNRVLDCIEKANAWINADALILDTETTGLGSGAEIVEICLIDVAGNPLLNTLIRPTKYIPDEAIAIHGITNDMVATAPTWLDIHERFLSLVADRTVVIYNADFDVQMIHQTSKKYDLVSPQIKSVCAMAMYSHFWGEWDYRRDNWHWQKLSDAAKQQGVRVEGNAHRALADCLMTLGVVNAVAANRNSTE